MHLSLPLSSVQAAVAGRVSGLGVPQSEPHRAVPALQASQDRGPAGGPAGRPQGAHSQPEPGAGARQPRPGVYSLPSSLLHLSAYRQVTQANTHARIYFITHTHKHTYIHTRLHMNWYIHMYVCVCV